MQTQKKSKSETDFDLDLSSYSKGLYLIRVYTSDQNYLSKLVKE